MRKDLDQCGKKDLNLATQEARQCLTAAAIWDMNHLDLRSRFQELTLKMRKRPDAGRPIAQRAGRDFARLTSCETALAGTEG